MDYIDPIGNARRLTAHYAEEERKREIAKLQARLEAVEALADEGTYERPEGPGDTTRGLAPNGGYTGPHDPADRTSAELREDLRLAIMRDGNPFSRDF